MNYEAITGSEIELDEKPGIGNSDQIDNTEYKKLKSQDEDEKTGTDFQSKPVKVSTFQRFKGILLVFIGGIAISIVGGVAKYLEHIPIGEYIFMQGVLTSVVLAPITYFFQPGISVHGKYKWVALCCLGAAVGGIIKFWSFIVMDLGDAAALYATSPVFAGIFARIMVKEKINIFTIISAGLGLSGVILIAKPAFVFGGSERGYSWFTLVTIFGAVSSGFSFSILRKIGVTSVHYLVLSLLQMLTIICFSVLFSFAKREELVYPGCYEDKIIMFVSVAGCIIALVCFTHGMAIERTGPATLVRNFDMVHSYLIQIVLFKTTPDLLSCIGATLILLGTLLIALNKLLPRKYQICEI